MENINKKEYKILYAEGTPFLKIKLEFEKEVQEYLNNGWKAQGGIATSTVRIGSDEYVYLLQAIVKE